MPMTVLTLPSAAGQIPAILHQPARAEWLLLLAHGAGAGMRHRFMEDMAAVLSERDVATLRYEFPYMSAGRRRPDPAPALEAISRAVAEWAAAELPALRLAAGGKSMGGRMTSRAQAAAPLPRVEKLVFLGFPLHPAGKPGVTRAEHLADVRIPMLFLQGDRDTLADLALMRDVCDRLSLATLHVLAGADHGLHVLKRSGRDDGDVLHEAASVAAAFLGGGLGE
jgi:uncharacterized protein